MARIIQHLLQKNLARVYKIVVDDDFASPSVKKATLIAQSGFYIVWCGWQELNPLPLGS
jgi:hypothetical protein